MTRVETEAAVPNETVLKEERLTRQSSGLSNLRLSSQRSQDLEAQLTEPLGSWQLRDLDWRFVISAQHYGTAIVTVAIVVALIVVHWTLKPVTRVFFLYDPSISYISHGDTIPAWVAVVVPLICLIISLLAYEFIIFRSFNVHITNAAATTVHFLLDCVYAFITVEFVTELTKFLAGRLRPDFLQDCLNGDQQLEAVWGSSAPVRLGNSMFNHVSCPGGTGDGRKSFPSGHASVSSSIMTYNIVYLIWSGYLRAEGASFMGLRRQTGWRGGHRLLREMGHGLYLLWILVQFAFVWAVGVSRFSDNKHNISDVIGGWMLGAVFALIYSTRAMALHQYVVLHFVPDRRGHAGR